MKTLISASILNSDMANLQSEIKRTEESGADMLHLDVMDGVFVESITFGDYVVASLRKHTKLPFDTHLMVHNPINLIPLFAKAGSDIITIHAESEGYTMESLRLIKRLGLKSGLAISPGTKAETVFRYMHEVDMVLVMTVEPGQGGQGFVHDMTKKIAVIRQKANELRIKLDIEVDGGINGTTAELALNSGANVLVAGTYLFKAENMTEAVRGLRK